MRMYHRSIDMVANYESHAEVNEEVVELVYAFVNEFAAHWICQFEP
jgi:hypothetical protein